MARDITAITTLRAGLEFAADAHVGASTLTGEAAPVLRDAVDRPIVPGTTWAGVLRALPGARGEDSGLWGTADGDGGASRVVVADSVIDLGGRVTGRREGVRIDRASGSAADQWLYAREVVPAGSLVELVVSVHSTAGTEDADLRFLSTLVARVENGDLRVGARTRRGLGGLRLASSPEVRQRRFDDADSFWRTRRDPRPVTLPQTATEPGAGVVEVEIAWRALTPVVVAEARATDVPLAPIMVPAAEAGSVRQLVPGTSVAGALRSRAELVCRTVRRIPTPEDPAEQLASAEPAAWLFGDAAGVEGATASPLTVEDCHSTTAVPLDRWLALLGPTAPRSVELGGGAEILMTDHVAVDRWTGGAADGRLFRTAEPHGFGYEPIRLRLDTSRIPAGRRDVAVALLLVAVRELRDGRVPLGAGTHRGLGHVAVDAVTVRVPDSGVDGPLDLGAAWFGRYRQAWQAWAHERTEVPA